MSERKRALAALLGAALLWSVGGVMIKWVPWHPLALMSARSAVTVVFLLALIRKPHFDGGWPQVGAGLANAATVLLYVPAVKMTAAANAILLQYTAPIWVAVLGIWLLKERPTWLDAICLTITLGGLILFFRDGISGMSSIGDLLALLSGVALASMTLLIRRQKGGHPLESILLGNIIAAIVGLPWLVASAPPTALEIGVVVLMGILQLGLSHVLYCYAIHHVTALEAILVATLEPVLNPLWVALFIGERPTGWALAGGLMVLLSVTVRGVVLSMPRALRRLGRQTL